MRNIMSVLSNFYLVILIITYYDFFLFLCFTDVFCSSLEENYSAEYNTFQPGK